jgi:hypothetical protein
MPAATLGTMDLVMTVPGRCMFTGVPNVILKTDSGKTLLLSHTNGYYVKVTEFK